MSPYHNMPELWRTCWPRPRAEGHKYDRGHLLVLGGPLVSTGASRLSARAALRIGAGLVSVACNSRALPVFATALEAVMTKLAETVADYAVLAQDKHISALLLGPGAGKTPETRDRVLASLATGKPTVLDADALTSFAGAATRLATAVQGPVVMTPHEGEFAALWPELTGSREQRAKQVAQQMQAVLVLKGPQTLIAAPDGWMAQQMGKLALPCHCRHGGRAGRDDRRAAGATDAAI